MAANPDGTLKATKSERHRSVRRLSPLAQDLREYRLAIGRPAATRLVLVADDANPWDKTAWQIWRNDRWAPACRAVGLHRFRARMTCGTASRPSCSPKDASRCTRRGKVGSDLVRTPAV